ncbi:hypothetical protein PFISCL1PPCAC_16440, partial [Pristionchus fissidentatus]
SSSSMESTVSIPSYFFGNAQSVTSSASSLFVDPSAVSSSSMDSLFMDPSSLHSTDGSVLSDSSSFTSTESYEFLAYVAEVDDGYESELDRDPIAKTTVSSSSMD